ncbi:MAG: hypothetical protein AVDCRST_MAG02-4476, partial [uncultured Rubrobacteraceae bacterium]
VEPKDAPVQVRGRYAPTPTDTKLLARYGEAIEAWAKEPLRRQPGRV